MGGWSEKRSIPPPCFPRRVFAGRGVRHVAPVPAPALGSALGQTPVSTKGAAGSRKGPEMGCPHQREGLVPPCATTLLTCPHGVTEQPHASASPSSPFCSQLSCPLQKLGATVAFGNSPQQAARGVLGPCGTVWGEQGGETGWNWENQ